MSNQEMYKQIWLAIQIFLIMIAYLPAFITLCAAIVSLLDKMMTTVFSKYYAIKSAYEKEAKKINDAR